MSSHPQAKFKSLTVVSTFELGTEEGSVLQLTEASRWSEVRLETEFESQETSACWGEIRAIFELCQNRSVFMRQCSGNQK